MPSSNHVIFAQNSDFELTRDTLDYHKIKLDFKTFRKVHLNDAHCFFEHQKLEIVKNTYPNTKMDNISFLGVTHKFLFLVDSLLPSLIFELLTISHQSNITEFEKLLFLAYDKSTPLFRNYLFMSPDDWKYLIKKFLLHYALKKQFIEQLEAPFYQSNFYSILLENGDFYSFNHSNFKKLSQFLFEECQFEIRPLNKKNHKHSKENVFTWGIKFKN